MFPIGKERVKYTYELEVICRRNGGIPFLGLVRSKYQIILADLWLYSQVLKVLRLFEQASLSKGT